MNPRVTITVYDCMYLHGERERGRREREGERGRNGGNDEEREGGGERRSNFSDLAILFNYYSPDVMKCSNIIKSYY